MYLDGKNDTTVWKRPKSRQCKQPTAAARHKPRKRKQEDEGRDDTKGDDIQEQ